MKLIEVFYKAFISVRNSSCGKVMFSQASVILSTRGEVYPPGQTPLSQTPPTLGRYPLPRDGHCSRRWQIPLPSPRRYPWNAFLFCFKIVKVVDAPVLPTMGNLKISKSVAYPGFPGGGAPILFLPHFLKNCMKLKKCLCLGILRERWKHPFPCIRHCR